MIHSVDPRQNRLFDPFDGVIPPAGRKIIGNGWQGVFRHVLLEVMPVGELGQHFSDSLGAATKELYSMAGLVFLTDFFGWTAQEAAEAYIFRTDIQYALNREPGAAVSTRTVERYQKLFRRQRLAARIFEGASARPGENGSRFDRHARPLGTSQTPSPGRRCSRGPLREVRAARGRQ